MRWDLRLQHMFSGIALLCFGTLTASSDAWYEEGTLVVSEDDVLLIGQEHEH